MSIIPISHDVNPKFLPNAGKLFSFLLFLLIPCHDSKIGRNFEKKLVVSQINGVTL